MRVDDELANLVSTHGDTWLRVAFQLTHDKSAAQDVVQEALVAVYRSWRWRGRLPEHPSAYVRRAILNEFLRGKRRRSSTEVALPDIDQLDRLSIFEREIAERDAMWRALGQLPPRQRAVLVLRHYEDLADPQIAEVLGCRRGTVRSLASRGIDALRRLDADTTDPGDDQATTASLERRPQ